MTSLYKVRCFCYCFGFCHWKYVRCVSLCFGLDSFYCLHQYPQCRVCIWWHVSFVIRYLTFSQVLSKNKIDVFGKVISKMFEGSKPNDDKPAFRQQHAAQWCLVWWFCWEKYYSSHGEKCVTSWWSVFAFVLGLYWKYVGCCGLFLALSAFIVYSNTIYLDLSLIHIWRCRRRG